MGAFERSARHQRQLSVTNPMRNIMYRIAILFLCALILERRLRPPSGSQPHSATGEPNRDAGAIARHGRRHSRWGRLKRGHDADSDAAVTLPHPTRLLRSACERSIAVDGRRRSPAADSGPPSWRPHRNAGTAVLYQQPTADMQATIDAYTETATPTPRISATHTPTHTRTSRHDHADANDHATQRSRRRHRTRRRRPKHRSPRQNCRCAAFRTPVWCRTLTLTTFPKQN